MSKYFPRQDIPQSQKNLQWCKDTVDFAIQCYDTQRLRMGKRQTRLWNSFLGKVDKSGMQYLTNTYGSANAVKFVDYRLAKPKIDLLIGEFLELPLKARVRTVNSSAKTEKLERFHTQMGMAHSAEEIKILRERVGVNVFDGMDVPNLESKDIWDKLDVKSKNEKAMQLIVDDHIQDKHIKEKFAENFQDVHVVAECFGKIEVSDDKQISYRDIDSRDAVYIESDRDPFLEKSPILGERRRMFIPDIFKEFGHEFSEDERRQVDELQHNASNYVNQPYRERVYYTYTDKQVTVDVFSLEWLSVMPVRRKVVPDKNDPNGEPFKKDISEEFYEKNRKKIRADVKKGKYKIETKWRIDVWEATKIGHQIYKRCRRKRWQYVLNDRPAYNMTDYMGMILPSRDGVRISLMEMLENVSHVYNILMYQINREITKAKGKVVAYDEAFLPKGKVIKDVMYNIANDSLLTYNSSEDGKVSEGDNRAIPGFQEIDLGLSRMITSLINLKFDLERTADRISGITPSREGLTPASATATSAQSDLRASRTITFPTFYFFSQYQARVFEKIAEKTKIVWGLGHDEDRGRKILGDKVFEFIKATKELANDDYGVYVTDARKEREVKDKMLRWAEAAINNRELRVQDAMRVDLSETAAEAMALLDESWEMIKEVEARSQREALKSRNAQIAAQIESVTEAREDGQEHDLEKIDFKGEKDKELAAVKAQGKLLEKEPKNIARAEPVV